MKKDKVVDERLVGTLREGGEVLSTPVGDFRLEFLEINSNNLERDLNDAPAVLGWVSSISEALRTQVDSKKLYIEESESELKRIEAEVFLDASERSDKKRTVDAIKAIVNSNVNVVEKKRHIITLKRELLELDHNRRQVSRIVSALELKGKLLQSSIGLKRSQMEMELQDGRAEAYARSKGEN